MYAASFIIEVSVVPAEAGNEKKPGFRVKPGMTNCTEVMLLRIADFCEFRVTRWRNTMKTSLLYMTVGSMDEARRIGGELVSSRLVACVNLIENMRSMYWWEDEIQEDKEVVLIAKTKASLVPELVERVKSIHSYDCPCVLSLPILDGNKAFLEWISAETI
jgi:periplasmic divalent cation tolerance protein